MNGFNNSITRQFKQLFLSGWLFWVIAFCVYACTIQMSFTTEDFTSIIAANLLDITDEHTSPLFIVLGRFFSLFSFGNTHVIAFSISLLSAVASAFSVYFIFRSVLYCAHTFVQFSNSYLPKTQNALRIGIASLAAVSFLFSNTVWHVATQPGIYSVLGFLFSALLYLIMQWHAHKNKSYGLRYLYLTAIILGLGVSVHVIILSIVPALFYFYIISTRTCTIVQKIKMLIYSFIILCVVWVLSTHGFFYIAAYIDLFFVNTFLLPLNSGILIFSSVLILFFFGILIYTYKKKYVRVHHFFVMVTLFVIGYSMYSVILIRANAQTPYNVGMQAHAFALTSHHSQNSNSKSLLYGTHFNAYSHGFSSESMYVFDSIQYTSFTTYTPAYHGAFQILFPRMRSTQNNHVEAYKEWAQIQEGKNTIPLYIHGVSYNKPTFFQNFKFFWKYQLGHMYGRYVLWNFVGQQNSIFGLGEPHKGNWITGIPLIDNFRLGAQDSLPQQYKENVSYNTYFALPLLFAFLGFIFIFRNAHKYSSFLILLFLVSGPGIVVWLNSVPYTSDSISFMYILSFIPICICIGFGIIPVYQYITKFTQQKAIIFTLGISAFVPLILFLQNIDDHTLNTTHSNPEVAIQYLNTCPLHTILILKDKEEAAPLEYAQSVLKIRQDIRIINYEMLSNPWYIFSLRKQKFMATPIHLSLPNSKYSLGVNNEMFVVANSHISHIYYPVQDILSFIASDNLEYKAKVSETSYVDYIPVPQTCISVPEYSSFSKKMYPALDSSRIVSHICWNLIPKIRDTYTSDTVISKQQLVLLDIIASNNWERPICFSKNLTEKEVFSIHSYGFNTGFYFQIYPMKAVKNYFGNGELLLETTFNNFIRNNTIENTNLSGKQIHDYCEMCINMAHASIIQNDMEKLRDIQLAYKSQCRFQFDMIHKKFEYAQMLFANNDTSHAYSMYAEISEQEQEKLLYFMHVPQKYHAKIIGEVLESLENMSELFDIYITHEKHTHCYIIASSTTIFLERFFEFIQQIEISKPNEFIEKNAWIYTLSEKNQLIAFWYNKMKVYLNS